MTAKRIFTVLISLALLVPFSVHSAGQHRGRYLCFNLYVQFGESVYSQIVYESGMYEIYFSSFWDKIMGSGRPIYKSVNDDDDGSMLQLIWCGSEKAWTFIQPGGNGNCTNSYIFKSSTTTSYDVIEIVDQTWYVRTPELSVVPVDWLAVACNDCETNNDICKGNCIDNKCTRLEEDSVQWDEDDQSHMLHWAQGLNFEQSAYCLTVVTDMTTMNSLDGIPGLSFFRKDTNAAEWVVAHDEEWVPTVHNRFVYFFFDSREGNNDFWTNTIRVFAVFGGRRWVIFGLEEGYSSTLTSRTLVSFLKANNCTINPAETLRQFQNDELLKNFKPVLFSSPVNYGTDSNSVDLSGMTWVRAKNDVEGTTISDASGIIVNSRPDDAAPIGVRLICAFCDESLNPCHGGGFCNSDNICECPFFYSGALCEYAHGCSDYDDIGCLNDGICAVVTNSCECQPGFYGSLCQFGPDGLEDVFLCNNDDGIICDLEAETELQRHSSCYCNCTYDDPICRPPWLNETLATIQAVDWANSNSSTANGILATVNTTAAMENIARSNLTSNNGSI